MASASLTFDRLAYIDRLTGGGIAEDHARTHAAALDAALRDSVATKSDVGTLGQELRSEMADIKRELREVEVRLDAKIETTAAAVKVDILRWLIVTQIALGGFTFAVAKLVH